MTEDLTPIAGRVFVALIDGRLKMVTVKSVRKRRDGTPSSCQVTWETGEVIATASFGIPKTGKMTGWRRVTLARIGLAKDLSSEVGSKVPTDAVVIVTRDRTGGEPVFA